MFDVGTDRRTPVAVFDADVSGITGYGGNSLMFTDGGGPVVLCVAWVHTGFCCTRHHRWQWIRLWFLKWHGATLGCTVFASQAKVGAFRSPSHHRIHLSSHTTVRPSVFIDAILCGFFLLI